MGLEFYSSRSERLKSASQETKKAYENRKNKSFLKRNPHLKIMLIDLILVLLFAVIIIPFFVKITKDTRFEDYRLSENVLSFDENILVSIKASKLYKKTDIKTEENSLKVEININDNIIDSKVIILPIKSGDDKYLTFKFLDNDNLEYIFITYTTDNFVKTKKVLIKR